MSDKPQHPAVLVLWTDLKPILDKVSNECEGLKRAEFEKLGRCVGILHALILTGELPPGVTFNDGSDKPADADAEPGDKGKQPATAPPDPPDRGKRQQRRRRERTATKVKDAPADNPASE